MTDPVKQGDLVNLRSITLSSDSKEIKITCRRERQSWPSSVARLISQTLRDKSLSSETSRRESIFPKERPSSQLQPPFCLLILAILLFLLIMT